MNTAEEKLVEMVNLVKEASDLINQLTTENEGLKTKLASASEVDKALTEQIKGVVNKMASVTVEGKPLIRAEQVERFCVGLQKQANALNIVSDLTDKLSSLTKASVSVTDKHDIGSPSRTKVATLDDSPLAGIAAGRIRM